MRDMVQLFDVSAVWDGGMMHGETCFVITALLKSSKKYNLVICIFIWEVHLLIFSISGRFLC